MRLMITNNNQYYRLRLSRIENELDEKVISDR